VAWRIDYEDALRDLVRRGRTPEQELAVLSTMVEWEKDGPPEDVPSLSPPNYVVLMDYGETIAYRAFSFPGHEPGGYVYVFSITRT
jgi:hypothetical protein